MVATIFVCRILRQLTSASAAKYNHGLSVMDMTVTEALERIAARNPALNAFISVLANESLDEARLLEEQRGRGVHLPLHGLPISIKDIIDVQGVPTTAASRVREGHVAESDAPVVARLRKAGAIIIGKTNLHEFALGTTNDESAFGPARNPHDLTRSPGGSSGGSGAAVAACLSWASIGTDTGGSIRIPAAACGVVGLKPSVGDVPTTGVVPLSPSLDHVGPIARSVADAWRIYDVLTGRPSFQHAQMPVRGLRLGRLGGYFLERLDVEVRRRFEEALERLRGAGASTKDVTIRLAAEAPAIYVNIALPEAYAYHAKTIAAVPDRYSSGVAARLLAGKDVSAERYVSAQRQRAALRAEVETLLAGYDALVLPTMPIPAPPIGATDIDVDGRLEPVRMMMLRLTQVFNLSGHPAISVPCGHTREGLPCGFQLVGGLGATAALLNVARACEPQITPSPFRCAGDY
jgi:aspartyl-tRNA(Asn)/glutamyl-tRNA(Gln) amidotransferase subunit A